MLPSMPIIFSTSRQGSPENNESIKDKESSIKGNDNIAQKPESIDEQQTGRIPSSNYESTSAVFESFPKDEKDCDDELVLLADNSPLSEKRKLLAQQVSTQTKKKKKIDFNHLEVSIDEKGIDEFGDQLAESYFMKAKSILDEQTFQKFIALLSESVVFFRGRSHVLQIPTTTIRCLPSGRLLHG